MYFIGLFIFPIEKKKNNMQFELNQFSPLQIFVTFSKENIYKFQSKHKRTHIDTNK